MPVLSILLDTFFSVFLCLSSTEVHYPLTAWPPIPDGHSAFPFRRLETTSRYPASLLDRSPPERPPISVSHSVSLARFQHRFQEPFPPFPPPGRVLSFARISGLGHPPLPCQAQKGVRPFRHPTCLLSITHLLQRGQWFMHFHRLSFAILFCKRQRQFIQRYPSRCTCDW